MAALTPDKDSLDSKSDSSLNTKSLDALIVGAGLCGLAAAIGLQKAGIAVTVLERASELKEVGAGIQIPPNAARVLSQLGIFEEVLSKSVRPLDIVLRNYRNGSCLYTLNLGSHAQEAYGFPLLVTHRADLCRILYDEARKQGAQIRFGCSVREINFEQPSVLLETGEQVAAHLVIGADGARSVCREALLNQEDPPAISGVLIYRICIDIDAMSRYSELKSLISPARIHTWLGPGAHMVCYRLKDVFNIVISQPEDGKTNSFDVTRGDLEVLRTALRDWEPRVQKLLEIAHETLRWPLLDSRQHESWVHQSGKFTLLGDSAHSIFPLNAQGAAMAFESAAILFGVLSKHTCKTQIPELLRAYNKARYARTSVVHELSHKSLEFFEMSDGPSQIKRDHELLHTIPTSGFPFALGDPVLQSWLWGFDATKNIEYIWKKYIIGNIGESNFDVI